MIIFQPFLKNGLMILKVIFSVQILHFVSGQSNFYIIFWIKNETIAPRMKYCIILKICLIEN